MNSRVADKARKTPFDPAKSVALTLCGFAEEEGLIIRALPSDRFAICPPLIITEAEIGELFDRLERAFAKLQNWVTAEKLI